MPLIGGKRKSRKSRSRKSKGSRRGGLAKAYGGEILVHKGGRKHGSRRSGKGGRKGGRKSRKH
jgi:hypothetical protein